MRESTLLIAPDKVVLIDEDASSQLSLLIRYCSVILDSCPDLVHRFSHCQRFSFLWSPHLSLPLS